MSNSKIISNDELEKMQNEVVVAYFKVLSQSMAVGTKKPQTGKLFSLNFFPSLKPLAC
jgi:hypothetical protein